MTVKPRRGDVLGAVRTAKRLLASLDPATKDSCGAPVWDGICEGARCMTIAAGLLYDRDLWQKCVDLDVHAEEE